MALPVLIKCSSKMIQNLLVQMILVDLDSLVIWEDWQDIGSKSYLDPTELDAYGFVWWQCLTVTVMWKRHLGQDHGCRTVQHEFSVHFSPSECTASEAENLLVAVFDSYWCDSATDLNDAKIFEILNDFALE